MKIIDLKVMGSLSRYCRNLAKSICSRGELVRAVDSGERESRATALWILKMNLNWTKARSCVKHHVMVHSSCIYIELYELPTHFFSQLLAHQQLDLHAARSNTPVVPVKLVYFLMNNHSVPKACFSKPPKAAQLPYMLDTVQLCIMGVLTILTTISIILYLEEALYLRKKVKCMVKRRTSLWSSAAPTVISIFTCLGLWIPRSTGIIDIAMGTYFALCFYLILMVIIEGYGGKDALVKKFEASEVHINTGPCCCCCPCLPRIKLTKKKVNLFILAVFQLAFLKPAFNIIGMILAADGIYNAEDLSSRSIAFWMGIILGFCTVLALWPIGILFREAKVHLAEKSMGIKFAVFQTLLILTTLQTSIFNLLGTFGVLPCAPPYAYRARASMMNSHLIIIETFILTVLARTAYRKKDEYAGYTTKALPKSSPVRYQVQSVT
ncbi:PREDICTED: organic solute transporter subunit alpha [Nanorana parkeri]|uniref:organic solute transporter subunit alpha n=1 Tax=Nanorana parkeri TaxID=125878 RepID=UPI000854AB70|nr:PREDICTED: organic solute transporter subunit alpha [Nanorana parkeri]